VQFVAIVLAILRFDVTLGPWRIDQWAMLLAVIVTLVSAGDYFARFRSIFSTRRTTD
jgi:phosphatidylglycerophosphate synthase